MTKNNFIYKISSDCHPNKTRRFTVRDSETYGKERKALRQSAASVGLMTLFIGSAAAGFAIGDAYGSWRVGVMSFGSVFFLGITLYAWADSIALRFRMTDVD